MSVQDPTEDSSGSTSQGVQSGDSNLQTNYYGPIYYGASSTDVTTKRTAWKIPLRSPVFTGRETILSKLKEDLSSESVSICVLHGFGGSGKTSIATEYVHLNAGMYDVAWWIEAEEPALISEQLRQLGVALGLAGPDADAAFAIAAVNAWLYRSDRWILVFDNARSPAELANYLPKGPGKILVTTRDFRWTYEIQGNAFFVDIFERKESANLLKLRGDLLTDKQIDDIADALGDFPLAVAQASSFLRESGITPESYLLELQRHAVDVLSEGVPIGYPRSLAATIRFTVETIALDNLAGVQLLRICAYLASEPVLLKWFPVLYSSNPGILPEPLLDVASSPFKLARSVAGLYRSGLVRVTETGDPILHRLTSSVLRDITWKSFGSIPPCQSAEALMIANDAGDPWDARTWPSWGRLTPHVFALDPAHNTDPRLQEMALDAVRAQLAKADPDTAETLVNRLLGSWGASLGENNANVIMARNSLSFVYWLRGDYQKAREINENAYARAKDNLGKDHPSTLRIMNHLGNNLRSLGEDELATVIDKESLLDMTKVMGAEHPWTLTAKSNYADDLYHLGQYDEARRLEEECFETRKRVVGFEHPSTLNSGNNLANILRALGQLENARALNESVLEVKKRILGEEHPYTILSMNDLADDLFALGLYQEARDMDESAFHARSRILGLNHPDTLLSQRKLARDTEALEGG